MTRLTRCMRVVRIAGLVAIAWPIAAQAIEPIPHPDLEQFKPEIREMLGGARQRFESMSRDAEGVELGIAYGRLGLHYYAHEIQDAARAAFNNAAELDPGNYRWHYYLAVQHDETGDRETAAALYERALALNPENNAIATRLGLALLELGRVDRAAAYFERVVDREPTSAAAHAGLARVADQRDRFEDAERYYLQALDLDPKADQLHYRLGQVYRRMGRMDDARSHLEKRGIRIPSIDDSTLAFMQAHARPASDYVVLGNLALSNGEAERAYKFFDLGAAIDPTNVDALIGQARIAFSIGDLNTARTRTAEARIHAPEDARVSQLLGLFADQGGNLEAAIAHFRNAVASDADFHEARLLLANALMRAGQFGAAANEYATLASTSDAHAGLSFQAGMAYIAGGECQGAEQNLLSAMQARPDTPQIVLALSRVYATCPDVTEDKRRTALEFAEAMYNSVPNMETSETYAMTLAANARYDDAVDLQAQAIFEAIKAGVLETNPHLKANMTRYREGKPAVAAWPSDHEIFSALPLAPVRAAEADR